CFQPLLVTFGSHKEPALISDTLESSTPSHNFTTRKYMTSWRHKISGSKLTSWAPRTIKGGLIYRRPDARLTKQEPVDRQTPNHDVVGPNQGRKLCPAPLPGE